MIPWAFLTEAFANQKLGHALMLAGGAAETRRDFARRFTGLLLCEKPQRDGEGVPAACGACRGCTQHQAGVHPNQIWLSPDEGKRDIGIEALRDAMARLSLSSHYGGRKLLVLDPVDRLNPHGRDALLKTLEEPPSDTHLILLVERLMSLSATLRSRCQIVRLPAAPGAAAKNTTADANLSALLDAVSQGRIQEPLAQLQSLKLGRDEWQRFGAGLTHRLHTALRSSQLGRNTSSFSWANDRQLSEWYRQAIQLLRALSGNANPQMLIESLMIKIWKSRAGRGST